MSLLSNIKVLELASVLAGPSVGQFFAELGAEVIKIESKNGGGDVTRSWKLPSENDGDLSAYFCSVNWGKKSVALDLTTQTDREIIHKLADQSDIIIASYKPGDSDKLGVDFKTLSDNNPKLIYGQITGYGSDNDRVGYDAVIQAEAGFMDLNGPPDGPPTKMPVALIDVLAAHHLKEGLLLALLERHETGKGKFIEVSLIQAAVSSLVNQASNWLVAGKLPKRQGSIHPNIAPYGELFSTADNKSILLAVGNNKQFKDLCLIIDAPELMTEKKFITNQQRVVNRVELYNHLQQRIKGLDSNDLIAKLNSKKVPAGKIQNLSGVFQLNEVQPILLRSGDLSGVRTFVGQQDRSLSLLPPPHFGEHTEEIINRLKGGLA